MRCSEVKIPAPWGHIAAKLWGNELDDALIVTHGLLDNAGSFNTLIPLLPPSFFYICVDFPGHGLSSHFPSGLPLQAPNFLLPIRIVADHFGRENYVLLGHSFGGAFNMIFAQMCPQRVSKLINLDAFYLAPEKPHLYLERIAKSHALLFKTLSQRAQPRYTWNEVVDKVRTGRWVGELTWKTAEDITRRMVEKVGEDEYEITLDRRLRVLTSITATEEHVEEMLKSKPVLCPALFIVTPTMFMLKGLNEAVRTRPNFEVRVVESHHHVHHTNPELVVPFITEFLLRKSSKL